MEIDSLDHEALPSQHDSQHIAGSCRFLELTAELRVLIYLLIIGGRKTTEMRFSPMGYFMTHPWPPAKRRTTRPTDDMAIFRTNRQVDTECSSMLFDATVFSIDVRGLRDRSTTAANPVLFSEYCASNLGFLLQRVRHLTLTVDESAKGWVLRHLIELLLMRKRPLKMLELHFEFNQGLQPGSPRSYHRFTESESRSHELLKQAYYQSVDHIFSAFHSTAAESVVRVSSVLVGTERCGDSNGVWSPRSVRRPCFTDRESFQKLLMKHKATDASVEQCKKEAKELAT